MAEQILAAAVAANERKSAEAARQSAEAARKAVAAELQAAEAKRPPAIKVSTRYTFCGEFCSQLSTDYPSSQATQVEHWQSFTYE